MGCGCNCDFPERGAVTACADCGLYGSVCCMVMTGLNPVTSEPETWVFSSDCGSGSQPPEITYSDDSCDQDSKPYCSGNSNLCGGMRTVQPCSTCGPSMFNAADCYATNYPVSTAPIAYYQYIQWEAREDCSVVDVKLWYRDGSVNGAGYFNETIYTTTIPINWLAPFTSFTIGPFTFSPCTPELPIRPLYVITCLEASGGGVFYESATTIHHSSGPNDCCSSGATEQCGLVHIKKCREPAGGGALICDSVPGLMLWWQTSPDYSEICFRIYLTGTRINYATPEDEVCIPYEAEWYNTPIGFTITYDTGPVDYQVAACGVIDFCEDTPVDCFPVCMTSRSGPECDVIGRVALFVSIEENDNCCLFGLWNMPYDGAPGYYLAPVGGPVGTCGILEMWLFCDGSDIKLRVRRVDGDTSVYDTTNVITLSCVDCEVSYSFDILSFGGGGFCQTGGFFEGARVTIFSNSGGC